MVWHYYSGPHAGKSDFLETQMVELADALQAGKETSYLEYK